VPTSSAKRVAPLTTDEEAIFFVVGVDGRLIVSVFG